MSTIDYGDSAFPFSDGEFCGSVGMTKREYFASKAMAATISNPGMTINMKDAAKDAVGYADALISELAKETQ